MLAMKEKAGPVVVGSFSSEQEVAAYKRLVHLHKTSPIPDSEILQNLGLYLNRSSLSRILFMQSLYMRILPIHGIIAEFGVRWGQNLALFSMFRTIYEPHNFSRKIVGFDTFKGFPVVSEKDGRANGVQPGAYGVSPGYEAHLEEILAVQERASSSKPSQKI